MHRQIWNEGFLWEIKSYCSYKNQTHMGKVFNTYAWTMINTRHARAGWISYGFLPCPDHAIRWQNMGWTSPCKRQCDFNCLILSATCFCSVAILCLWQNCQFLGSSQCGSEKWQCHPLRFYWIFVPVAATQSVDKGSQGKTITGCFFQMAIPRSLSMSQLPSPIECALKAASLPSAIHSSTPVLILLCTIESF